MRTITNHLKHQEHHKRAIWTCNEMFIFHRFWNFGHRAELQASISIDRFCLLAIRHDDNSIYLWYLGLNTKPQEFYCSHRLDKMMVALPVPLLSTLQLLRH